MRPIGYHSVVGLVDLIGAIFGQLVGLAAGFEDALRLFDTMNHRFLRDRGGSR
jgi:hypothetical protein